MYFRMFEQKRTGQAMTKRGDRQRDTASNSRTATRNIQTEKYMNTNTITLMLNLCKIKEIQIHISHRAAPRRNAAESDSAAHRRTRRVVRLRVEFEARNVVHTRDAQAGEGRGAAGTARMSSETSKRENVKPLCTLSNSSGIGGSSSITSNRPKMLPPFATFSFAAQ